MKTTKRDIKQSLKALRKAAKDAYKKGDLTESMRFILRYAEVAGQFNFQYVDDEVEYLLDQIAHQKIRKIEQFVPREEHWVFYDDFCSTYVLALQWVEALAATGNKILYLTSRDVSVESRHKNILDRVAQYDNVQIKPIPSGNLFKQAQDLYDEIVAFEASKLILHKNPVSSLAELVLPVLPKEITRYVINLSDQTYWQGARSIDYCLEFRPFGASVSVQRRGLKENQLLMVPFYPADDQNIFGGFPPECTADKVVIFSGGDYYKTLDEKRTYWRLVKAILEKYPEVVFLFATKNIPEGDAEIQQFIKENHFEGRFIYINFRQDIYQVFAHCDIYMGTCPTSGSLMSQLAAINGKPILQYYHPGISDDETEQAICINDVFKISDHFEQDFLEHADRLIFNAQLRKQQGERLQHAMMQEEQFNKLVKDTLETNQTQMPLGVFEVNYSELDDRWFYLEKAGYIHTVPYVYSILGVKNCFRWAPVLFLKKNLQRFMGI